MDSAGQTKSIRVAVRVRPLLPSDGASEHSLLQLDPGRPNEVLLASANDRRTARRYTFDHVFGPDVSQDELYGRAGISEMVASVVDGYHATVFAYGQTGSGKTHTMEGYRYVAGGAAGTAAAAVGAAGGRGGAARAGASVGATVRADFSTTPDEQLGLTPRAVRELFAAVSRGRSRRFQIRCSFVQIYREQVYDLLNPATLAALPGGSGGGGGGRRPGGPGTGGGGAGGPLRMRWSQQEGFYLENLFTPEVESAEEAISAFQSGVANKVMSSHRLNASSSRSHCLFTLHVASAPAASPLEQRTAKLTLVDLAGSERAALTGATEGALRDESVAINKSLFTLRQVITALTDAAAAAANQSPSGAPTGSPAAATAPHVPYRDSKLTCLLKHSLGGNSLTLMMACLSPADRFHEENASTLDYAARARRITNQVAVNEDPRSRLIRELRAEVAFLRQQLEAAGASPPPPALAAAFGGGSGAALKPTSGLTASSANNRGSAAAVAAAAAAAAAAPLDGEAEAELASRLRSSDVEVLVRAVIEASRVAVASAGAMAGLRAAYARTCASLESLRIEYDTLAVEDARLRDRLSLLEALVATDERGGSGAAAAAGNRPMGPSPEGSATADAAGLYTASTAALIELEELRRENALLHERLRLLEPEIGPSGVVMSVTRGSGGPRPGTSAWTGAGLAGTARNAPARVSGARPATSGSSSHGLSMAVAGPRGAGAGTLGAGRRPNAQRAQSAGALLPTGTGRRNTTAAAAAAANPFIPNDVLMAVLPPPPPPRPSQGVGTGGGRGGSATRPVTRAGSSSGGGGSGSCSSKTLTLDQLRNVLQLGGSGDGAPAIESGAASLEGLDPGDSDGGSAVPTAPSAGSSRPPTSGLLLSSSSSSNTATTSGRLSELGHAVASRALASGVRLSTTGKLLPAAPARMAVEAAAGGGGGSPLASSLRPGTSAGATASRQERPPLAGAGAVGGALPPSPPPQGGPGSLPPETALVHLLAERNALTRQRLAGAQ